MGPERVRTIQQARARGAVCDAALRKAACLSQADLAALNIREHHPWQWPAACATSVRACAHGASALCVQMSSPEVKAALQQRYEADVAPPLSPVGRYIAQDMGLEGYKCVRGRMAGQARRGASAPLHAACHLVAAAPLSPMPRAGNCWPWPPWTA